MVSKWQQATSELFESNNVYFAAYKNVTLLHDCYMYSYLFSSPSSSTRDLMGLKWLKMRTRLPHLSRLTWLRLAAVVTQDSTPHPTTTTRRTPGRAPPSLQLRFLTLQTAASTQGAPRLVPHLTTSTWADWTPQEMTLPLLMETMMVKVLEVSLPHLHLPQPELTRKLLETPTLLAHVAHLPLPWSCEAMRKRKSWSPFLQQAPPLPREMGKMKHQCNLLKSGYVTWESNDGHMMLDFFPRYSAHVTM